MSRVVINPQPKFRFQESGGNISQHRDLLQSVAFQRAIDWALLQYQRQLCEEEGDLNQMAAKHLKIKGAQEFVKVIFMLAESAVPEMANRILNLLKAEGVLDDFRGNEGQVYTPNRAAGGRMKELMAQLTLSKDPIWIKVSAMDIQS